MSVRRARTRAALLATAVLVAPALAGCANQGTETPATAPLTVDSTSGAEAPEEPATPSATPSPASPSPSPSPTAAPAPAAVELNDMGIGDVVVGDPDAVERLTALWGEPDSTDLGDDPNSLFAQCGTPFISGYTWGDLEVLTDDDGGLHGWQLVGTELPTGAQLPLDLEPTSTLAEGRAATGLDAVPLDEGAGGGPGAFVLGDGNGVFWWWESMEPTQTPTVVWMSGVFCD